MGGEESEVLRRWTQDENNGEHSGSLPCDGQPGPWSLHLKYGNVSGWLKSPDAGTFLAAQ